MLVFIIYDIIRRQNSAKKGGKAVDELESELERLRKRVAEMENKETVTDDLLDDGSDAENGEGEQ